MRPAKHVDGNKLHVVLTPVDSSAISKADETWRYTERVYYDAKHTKLAYARHYVITRHGRELSSIQRAFITDKADPNAEDFSTTDKMPRCSSRNSPPRSRTTVARAWAYGGCRRGVPTRAR